MTHTPSRVSVQDLTELQNSAKAQLVRAIEALNRLSVQIDEGQVGPKSEANKVLGDIRDWLKIAHEVELRLEKFSQESGKREHTNTVDLVEARRTIGRRLDRLRRSGCPGCVPK